MITFSEYAGLWINHPDFKRDGIKENATILLARVNALLTELKEKRIYKSRKNPNTKSLISGKTYGGFRPQDCPQGAPLSTHKTARGIDIYDPYNEIDNYIDKNPDILERHNLWREASSATNTWCHLQSVAPKSGKRTYLP